MAAKPLKPKAGNQYRVVATDNPHHGKVIIANAVTNGVVTPLGLDYLFMASELAEVSPSQTKRSKPRKPTLRQKCNDYESLLNEVLSLSLPKKLKGRIEKALKS
ncbi:MAG: hypothetical protein AAF635_10040 [Cyanobacteria bacterium P01_C01_bin.69]